MKDGLRIAIALALFVALAAVPTRAQKPTTSQIMKLKLTHAQKILEGIAREDFDSIGSNAQALSLLSHESNWRVFQTVEYNEYSADFRRVAGRVQRHAKEKNLDAAALDYVQLTVNCVNCHKYVRSARKP